jgi:signal transduction histidine kinase
MALPGFILELQDRENQGRYLQAIRTRYLLILGIWAFVTVTRLLFGITFYLTPIHIIAGSLLVINTISFYLTRRWRWPLVTAISTSVIDVIAITVLVYFTGGFNSIFFILYLVEILGVSLFLNLYFSAIMVAWAVVMVGTSRVLESAGLIGASSSYIPATETQFTYTIIWLVFQAMILCLVAFLGGNLSSKLKTKDRELKRKQELEKLYAVLQQADETKARLLVNISHNLRTPLTSLMGFSELLASTENDEKQRREFAQIIHKESQHLSQLVDNLPYLAQLEAERVEWHMEEADISQIVTEAADGMRDPAAQKGLKLLVDNPDIPLLVYGDRESLKDVVFRLIDNAIKFTLKGSINVGINRENGDVCIRVDDTGIGIAADVKDRLFEPLAEIYKIEYRDVPQRTGLGLSICKAVIRHHGGKIWFDSRPGRGSSFYFTLPLIKSG